MTSDDIIILIPSDVMGSVSSISDKIQWNNVDRMDTHQWAPWHQPYNEERTHHHIHGLSYIFIIHSEFDHLLIHIPSSSSTHLTYSFYLQSRKTTRKALAHIDEKHEQFAFSFPAHCSWLYTQTDTNTNVICRMRYGIFLSY